MKRILIAGIGNIFQGDDAFGVEVVHELNGRCPPPGVDVVDFGIRAYDLAYALTDSYDAIILVDAAPRGQAPGTLYLIEPDLQGLNKPEPTALDAHSLTPVTVLRIAQSLGALPGKLWLVGCEPGMLESENGDFGLSESVKAAVPQAIAMIESLLDTILHEHTNDNAGLVPA